MCALLGSDYSREMSPEVHCLVVIDMQRAFVEGSAAVSAKDSLVRAVNTQLDQARSVGALVVHLQNDGAMGASDEPGTWGWQLSISPHSSEILIRKQNDNAFAGTELHAVLQEHHVKVLSVCGVLSEMCVAATARAAVGHGYDVILAHDSHATYSVPPCLPTEPVIPAGHAACVAEWSLGDAVTIPPRAADVRFAMP